MEACETLLSYRDPFLHSRVRVGGAVLRAAGLDPHVNTGGRAPSGGRGRLRWSRGCEGRHSLPLLEGPMRSKLTLNLDDLSVDSFDTSTTRNAKGTVFGE